MSLASRYTVRGPRGGRRAPGAGVRKLRREGPENTLGPEILTPRKIPRGFSESDSRPQVWRLKGALLRIWRRYRKCFGRERFTRVTATRGVFFRPGICRLGREGGDPFPPWIFSGFTGFSAAKRHSSLFTLYSSREELPSFQASDLNHSGRRSRQAP
jgi:hypothetical protein